MWRMRIAHDAPRYLLYAACAAGLAASARFAIAPPHTEVSAPVPAPAPRDIGAEGFAAMFTRRYLSWNGVGPRPSAAATGLEAGPSGESEETVRPPTGGEQRVEWTEVVQERDPEPGEHVYTVAAKTDSGGLQYLAVEVMRRPGGSLALVGYPALVGLPASAPVAAVAGVREVANAALAVVVKRALRNYLADASEELAADLAPGARVSAPAQALELQSVQRLRWSSGGHSLVAVLGASDRRGAQYTLAYELDVRLAQGRWEISAIEMDPNA
jgi:hypothetical protein